MAHARREGAPWAGRELARCPQGLPCPAVRHHQRVAQPGLTVQARPCLCRHVSGTRSPGAAGQPACSPRAGTVGAAKPGASPAPLTERQIPRSWGAAGLGRDLAVTQGQRLLLAKAGGRKGTHALRAPRLCSSRTHGVRKMQQEGTREEKAAPRAQQGSVDAPMWPQLIPNTLSG